MPNEPQVSAKWTGPVGSSDDAGPIAVQIVLDPALVPTLTSDDDAVLGSLVRVAAERLLVGAA
jgi:hypothetical protein